ncbi:ERF family protein [Companilactobacillus keshanensis]|uniref:ERF family protein n=1 Tax=Companilactobacillus keshanensis TaxID=2486003 RepID=A0ABW4BT79_9LACO|nr:ERF family protein [Companilactobacillus keshanensis]
MKVNEALISIREKIQNPEKKGLNPMFKSSYVELNDVLKVIANSLPEQASFTQPINVDKETGDSYIELHIITDEDEKTVSTMKVVEMDGNRGTNKLQMFGQSITYLRRYQLQSYFGLGAEDNDGSSDQNQQQRNNSRSTNRSSQSQNSQSQRSNLASKTRLNLINGHIEKLAEIMGSTNKAMTKVLRSHFPNVDFQNITNDVADEMLVDLNKQIDEAKQAIVQMAAQIS